MDLADFLKRWADAPARERAHYQQFFLELCAVLDLPVPDPAADGDRYCFERDVPLLRDDATNSPCRIDLYREGAVVLEFKQGSGGELATGPVAGPRGTAKRGTAGWDMAMRRAFVQARAYALALPGRKAPHLITCDIGYYFEVWSDYSGTGSWGEYGARRTIRFDALNDPEVRTWLRTAFLDPHSQDPALHAAKVTREVARHLAGLARSLEAAGHPPRRVARFLMGCLFTMFAEDVELLPAGIFTGALRQQWLPHPEKFAAQLTHLWQVMDKGGSHGFDDVRHFNGGLLRNLEALPLTREQLELLLEAAQCDWSQVEPAIFGTLLERALDDHERSKLGAHFTPRAYIERLVKPALMEPLREEWIIVQAQVQDRARSGTVDTSRDKQIAELLHGFHDRLCRLRVLDPACGSGNFLYVSLDLLKGLEAEVLREMEDLGVPRPQLGIGGLTVNPAQFIGVEKNPRAREVTELVLWLGYLQWQRRTLGGRNPPEPILAQHHNIESRDAVLTWTSESMRRDEHGHPVTVWDMRTYTTSPLTGERIPDETARTPVLDYAGVGKADWPEADFIVGNPPFVGNKMMRQYLGDGYAEALREAWPEVPQTADLVMYWWERAARLVREGRVRRFGFITTNSITQVFNRKVVEPHLVAKDPLVIAWAIPDHPWVDDGADVRIAMTVGARAADVTRAMLGRVVGDGDGSADDAGVARVEVEVRQVDRVHADLRAGADVAGATELIANRGVAFTGMYPLGLGFVLDPAEDGPRFHDGDRSDQVVKPFFTARDLTRRPRGARIIDFYPRGLDEVREAWPHLYQWVLERVKPQRDQDKNPERRRNWWLFTRPIPDLRAALASLDRYIVVPRTAKFFTFQFIESDTIVDTSVVAIASPDAALLGLLSSRHHLLWAVAAGGRLGVGNDPRYQHSRTFNTFPFPRLQNS